MDAVWVERCASATDDVDIIVPAASKRAIVGTDLPRRRLRMCLFISSFSFSRRQSGISGPFSPAHAEPGHSRSHQRWKRGEACLGDGRERGSSEANRRQALSVRSDVCSRPAAGARAACGQRVGRRAQARFLDGSRVHRRTSLPEANILSSVVRAVWWLSAWEPGGLP